MRGEAIGIHSHAVAETEMAEGNELDLMKNIQDETIEEHWEMMQGRR